MNYKKEQIKEGINLHTIKTNKFKTNLTAVFLSMPLKREDITKEAVISSVLRRGSNSLQTSEQISIALEEMYGASFDCGIEKIGDYHVLKFYLETINDEFLPKKEDVIKKAIDTLFDIVFNPLVKDNAFNDEYVKTEKENIKRIIEGKKDNKSKYALDRCIEEMYKGKPYGLYKYGYVEDLNNIDNVNLYEFYKSMINSCKIDIFVSGNIDESNIVDDIKQNENISKLQERKLETQNVTNDNFEKEKVITEKMDVTQGKLILGLNVNINSLEEKYITLLYNAILGGGANSKLFQNVREKAHLAYVAGSNYIRQKDAIFIRCGIEIENFDKTLDIVKKQLEDMKQGNFTDQDLQNAKTAIISTIKFISDEQDTEISYYFGQEIVGKLVSLEEYANIINKITKEQIQDIANRINTSIIYFLTSNK